MGTSGSFKGSGGADARSLRDAVSEWLDNAPVEATDQRDAVTEMPRFSSTKLAPILRLWSRGSSGGQGGAGGSGSSAGRAVSEGGRSGGGVKRAVRHVAVPAGRASTLVRAFTTGDRQTIEAAGLNFDELTSLIDPLEVGRRIVEAAFDTQPDGSVEDSESRLIVAQLVAWMMEFPAENPRRAPDIVRRTMELMICQSVLNEVGSTIRQEKNAAKRIKLEAEIRAAATVLVSKVEIGAMGISSDDISRAIVSGVSRLSDIFGADQ